MGFKKAVKIKQRLRLAIDGISGSGKTYTALAIASGMGGSIALVDSEHGSASLYADRFEFDTMDLTSFQIEDYVNALDEAAKAKYPIVIVDSTSHAWDALVERVDRIARQKFGGNTFAAWAEGTPLQKKLIEALLNYPGHVIVTCRSKSEYSVDKDDKGKTKITKVGLAAVQRQGFEYEFTMAMTMDANHVGFVTKDRTSKYQDKFIEKPGKKMGGELIAWLNEGAAPPPPSTEELRKEAIAALGNILDSADEFGNRVFDLDEKKAVGIELRKGLEEIPEEQAEQKLSYINSILDRQTLLLQERVSREAPESLGQEQPGNDSAPTPAEEPSGAEAAQGNPDARAAAEEEFEDDIPWGDEENAGKGKGRSPKGKPAPAAEAEKAASGELDIY